MISPLFGPSLLRASAVPVFTRGEKGDQKHQEG